MPANYRPKSWAGRRIFYISASAGRNKIISGKVKHSVKVTAYFSKSVSTVTWWLVLIDGTVIAANTAHHTPTAARKQLTRRKIRRKPTYLVKNVRTSEFLQAPWGTPRIFESWRTANTYLVEHGLTGTYAVIKKAG